EEWAGDALESMGGAGPAGAATGPQQRHDLVPCRDLSQEAGEGKACIGEPSGHIAAAHERRPIAMAREVGKVGRRGHEAIGFVMEARNRDPRHSKSSRSPARFLLSGASPWVVVREATSARPSTGAGGRPTRRALPLSGVALCVALSRGPFPWPFPLAHSLALSWQSCLRSSGVMSPLQGRLGSSPRSAPQKMATSPALRTQVFSPEAQHPLPRQLGRRTVVRLAL